MRLTMLRACLPVLLLLLTAAPAAAQSAPDAPASPSAPTPIQVPQGAAEAPFGLYWGITKEELEKAGIKLIADPDTSLGAIYSATNLPKAVSDIESVRLYLGFGGKLFKIIAASRIFPNDPYGSDVQTRYGELVKVLTDKYGAGKESKFTEELYDGNNWGMGIKTNQNWLYTDFETKELTVQISCRAHRSSDLILVLVYEWKPGGALEQKAQKEHEKGAL